MKRIALMGACACLALPAMAAGNVFNPDISLILQGRYVHADDGAGGFPAGFFPAAGHEEEGDGHEHGAGGRGFSLDHSELVLSASIDHRFHGFAVLGVEDDAVELEEAWFQTLALGGGFNVKGGRFLSQIGYVNEQHAHAWDFADQSLVYRAMFGGRLVQDGAQARWLAPTPMFLEFGIEAARGQFFPGSEVGSEGTGAGTRAAFIHLGDDLGLAHSWRAGLSYVDSSPRDRHAHIHDAADVETEAAFSGKSRTWIVDLVWKWAPEGNARDRYLKLQAEYMHRRERGELGCEDNLDEGGLCDGGSEDRRSSQSGFYAQAIYQFMPRWRLGYRYDRLDPGSLSADAVIGAWLHADHDPERHTAMLDFSPSEFSRLRFQVARDHATEERETIATVQYIMSLGAHGAHKF